MPPDNIQFNTEEPSYARPVAPPVSFITGLVIRAGLAKDERGAKVAMLIVAVVAAALAVSTSFFLMPQPTGPSAEDSTFPVYRP